MPGRGEERMLGRGLELSENGYGMIGGAKIKTARLAVFIVYVSIVNCGNAARRSRRAATVRER